MKNKGTIYFDMDGTIANLYGVENWLADLEAHRTTPYQNAKVMLHMATLARLIHRAQKNGYAVGIISWLSKSGTDEYNAEVAEVKRKWLKTHLKSVEFDAVHIVPYGTPKSTFAQHVDILFDDEVRNRSEWIGKAYPPERIFEILKKIS
jgi:hypothetical protein